MRRSGKQRKAELQLKRAVKRGDIAPPEAQPRRKNFRRPPKLGHSLDARLLADDASRAARKLQSQFVKLDPGFLETTKHLAATLPLTRPISADACLLGVDHAQSGSDLGSDQLSVPRRPKWKYTMSKDDVDANEQGYFRRWMTQTDVIVERWHNRSNQPVASGTDLGSAGPSDPDTTVQDKMPCPPTHFERNLEVWRQLVQLASNRDISNPSLSFGLQMSTAPLPVFARVLFSLSKSKSHSRSHQSRYRRSRKS